MFTHKTTWDEGHPHATAQEARDCEAAYLEWEADEARAEIEVERRNERFFEERGGGTYAGSYEEARDRYLDGLFGR